MLTRLRPIFALFVRSLREQSRAKFTPLARGSLALLLLLFIAGNERSFTHRTAPGQQVLILVVMVNFFAIAIFGLSTFASAITEEKEDDTLGLLQMTRLNPLAILLGKSTARLCEGLLLLAVQIPFTMLCITLGGVSMDQVLRCFAILAAFLFFLCNIALLWSVVCRRTARATAMTVATGIAFYVMPLFLFSIALASSFGGRSTPSWIESVVQYWIGINPIFDLTRSVLPRGGLPFATESITTSLIGGVVFFGLAWLLFKPCCNSSREAIPQAAKKSPASGQRTPRGRPGQRAIAWKDFHFLGGGKRGLLIRAAIYVLFALLLVWWLATINRSALRSRQVGVMFWVFGVLCFSVEFGLVSARMFAAERKRKTLGVLYTLPNGTGRLVREKILGGLPQLLPSAALAITGLFMIFNQPDFRNDLEFTPEFAAGLTLIVSGYVFFAVLVMYLSLRMRRAPFATGLCVIVLLWIVIAFSMDGLGVRGSEVAQMLTLSTVAWICTLLLASGIPHRIAVAAASE
jgi:ABC-type transport system involved in multi-copper enzyme maturation permease subunit